MKTKEERQAAKEQKAAQRAMRDFDESPAGLARQALKDGRRIFELRLDDDDASDEIEQVESEGWRLEHAGWVTHPSKGHFDTTELWHTTGVFLFRRVGA